MKALGDVAHLVGARSPKPKGHQKVTGSIPGQVVGSIPVWVWTD